MATAAFAVVIFVILSVMATGTLEIDPWLERVRKAANAREVFAILEEFRPLSWSAEQRASMAKAYVRVLERVGVKTDQAASGEVIEKDDGPVWYEKM